MHNLFLFHEFSTRKYLGMPDVYVHKIDVPNSVALLQMLKLVVQSWHNNAYFSRSNNVYYIGKDELYNI